MLQLFRNSNPFSVILLFLLAMLVHMPGLLHPVVPTAHPVPFGSVVLHLLDRFLLHRSSLGYAFAGIISLWGGAIYANGIASRNKLFGKSTALPGLTIILFSGLAPAVAALGVHSILMWALLIALDCLLSTAQPRQPRKQVFNAGFSAGLLALLSLPCGLFFLLVVAGMLLLRRPSPAEWIVGLFGLATPFYFAAGLLFLGDDLPVFRQWAHLPLLTRVKLPLQSVPFWVAASTVAVYMLFGLFALQRSLGKTAISVRRSWAVCLIGFGLSIIVWALIRHMPGAVLLLLIMGSFPAAVTFNRIKAPRFTNFMALLLIAVVIYCRFQYTP